MSTFNPIAFTVPIQDVGGYYVSTQVEGALQEIGAALGGGGLVNWTEAIATAAPNNVIAASSFIAKNAGFGSIDAVFIPKGSGAIVAAVPDGTATGGNKRGTNAVDLQRQRALNTQVAANDGSAIIGGVSNRAAGNTSFIGAGTLNTTNDTDTFIAGGRSNSVTGPQSFACGGAAGNGNTVNASSAACVGGYAHNLTGNFGGILGGEGNTVSAQDAIALGGAGNAASGVDSVVMGERADANGMRGAFVQSAGRFGVGQPSQTVIIQLRGQTTDATPKILTADGGAASALNQMTLINNSAIVSAIGQAIARDVATGDTKAWSVLIVTKRGANAAATTMPTGITSAFFNDAGAAAWTLAAAADTTNGSAAFTFTGAVGKTIDVSLYLPATWTT